MNEHYEDQEPKSLLEEVDWETVANETGFEPKNARNWDYVYKIYRYSYIGFFVLLFFAKGIAGAMGITAHIFALNIALFLGAGLLAIFVGFFPVVNQRYWKRVTWTWGILAVVAVVLACIITIANLSDHLPKG